MVCVRLEIEVSLVQELLDLRHSVVSLSKKLYPLLSTGSTQEDWESS